MNVTTANRMKFLAKGGKAKYDVRLQESLKEEAIRVANEQGIDLSDFTRHALVEKIERDTAVPA